MLSVSKHALGHCKHFCFNRAAIKVVGVSLQQKAGYASLGELIQNVRFNYFDNPRHHLDHDKWCKYFCIEGNMSSGKSKFAKELAARIPVKHYPQATTNYDIIRMGKAYPQELIDWHLNPNSVAQKSRMLSVDKLWSDPTDWVHTLSYQYRLTVARFLQYNDAFVNILGKGEGAVLVQHFYSDLVFTEAQREMKWIDKKYWDWMDLFHFFMDQCLLPPQVIIYLDVPAEQCYEAIQAGDNEAEKNIPLKYLQAVERIYKTKFLPKARDRGVNVIELDWSNPGDMDEIVDQLDDMPSLLSPTHWWDGTNTQLKKLLKHSRDDHELQQCLQMYCPFEEVWRPPWFYDAFRAEKRALPHKYQKGFNSDLGDKWIFLKS